MLVWPENHVAVQLFMACQTLWRKTVVATMAGAQIIYDGLDYAQVRVVMEMLFADADQQDTFARLLVMEREALNLLNQNR